MLCAVSRAPLAKLQAYMRRMGWGFPWASSSGSDFNYDFHAAHTPEQQQSGAVDYNFRTIDMRPELAAGPDNPWVSALVAVLHLYWALGGSAGLASSAGRDLATRRPASFFIFGLYGVAVALLLAVATGGASSGAHLGIPVQAVDVFAASAASRAPSAR